MCTTFSIASEDNIVLKMQEYDIHGLADRVFSNSDLLVLSYYAIKAANISWLIQNNADVIRS